MTTESTVRRINVTLSAYEGDDLPVDDEKFEAYVLAELRRQHPTAAIEVSTAQGRTKVFVDGEPDQDLAQEISNDWWAQFCSDASTVADRIADEHGCEIQSAAGAHALVVQGRYQQGWIT